MGFFLCFVKIFTSTDDYLIDVALMSITPPSPRLLLYANSNPLANTVPSATARVDTVQAWDTALMANVESKIRACIVAENLGTVAPTMERKCNQNRIHNAVKPSKLT